MTDTATETEQEQPKEVLAVDAAERIGIRLDGIEERISNLEAKLNA